MLLLRLSTLATGRTGVRLGTARCYAALLDRRHHPGGGRVRLAGLLGRPGPARGLRAGADRRGHGARRRRGAAPGRRGAGRGRDRAGGAAREGGPRADQRHRRDARHAAAGLPRPGAAAAHRGRHGGDERGGAAGHRRRLRRRPAGAAPAPRPGRERGEPAGAARRLAGSSPATATPAAPACRTPTRCAARRRCTARPATPSPTRWPSPTASWPSAVDNPVVLPDGRVESNGNFHGAPVAYVLDFLAIAVADLAGICERRTDRHLDVARNHGLPAFLADDAGVDSGHMIAQYTAGGDRRGAQAAGRAGRRRTRYRPRRCRRTTCRWAGPRPASCAGPSTG